jgi:hypothetical protein
LVAVGESVLAPQRSAEHPPAVHRLAAPELRKLRVPVPVLGLLSVLRRVPVLGLLTLSVLGRLLVLELWGWVLRPRWRSVLPELPGFALSPGRPETYLLVEHRYVVPEPRGLGAQGLPEWVLLR